MRHAYGEDQKRHQDRHGIEAEAEHGQKAHVPHHGDQRAGEGNPDTGGRAGSKLDKDNEGDHRQQVQRNQRVAVGLQHRVEDALAHEADDAPGNPGDAHDGRRAGSTPGRCQLAAVGEDQAVAGAQRPREDDPRNPHDGTLAGAEHHQRSQQTEEKRHAQGRAPADRVRDAPGSQRPGDRNEASDDPDAPDLCGRPARIMQVLGDEEPGREHGGRPQ